MKVFVFVNDSGVVVSITQAETLEQAEEILRKSVLNSDKYIYCP